jgi:P-type E1-E2 ATPase
VIGVFGIVDSIKEQVASPVAALRKLSVTVLICSGDHELTVTGFAQQVGIYPLHVCAGASPENEANLVSQLQEPAKSGAWRTSSSEQRR